MLLDMFNNREVTVGCTIVYSGRAGSRSWLTTGRVLEIDEGIADRSDPQWTYQRRHPRIKVTGGHSGNCHFYPSTSSFLKNDAELRTRWVRFDQQNVCVVRP